MTAGRSRTALVPRRDRAVPPPVRVVVAILLAIAYISLVAHREFTDKISERRAIPFNEATVGMWQYLREGLVLLLVLLLLNGTIAQARARGRLHIPGTTVAWALFLGVVVVTTIARGGAGTVLYGARFVTIPLLLVLLAANYDLSTRQSIARQVSVGLIPYLILQAAVTFGQLSGAPPVYGAGMFGTRGWGTFPAPNNLGLTMVGLVLIFVVGRPRCWQLWATLAFGVAFLTGTRLAILAILLIPALRSCRRSKARLVALIPLGLLGFAAYTVASTKAVSGRELDSEARLGVWANMLSKIDSPIQAMLGSGLGVGTNAELAAGGGGGFITGDGGFTDSTVLAVLFSMGIFGLIGGVAWLLRLRSMSDPQLRFVLWPPILLASLAFNITELSPFNVLAAAAAAVALGSGAREGSIRPAEFFCTVPGPTRIPRQAERS